MTFSDLGLRPDLSSTVAELGYEAPSPIQAELIPVLLAGRDAVGQARTGTGKTAAFGLPTLQKLSATDTRGTVRALVLVPTRELAVQVASALHTYARGLGMRMLPVTGGTAYHKQTDRLRAGVDVVVATPGRLVDLLGQGAVDLSAVETVVLDEADEMFSMGFADDLAAILDAVPAERQTVLLSATMPAGIRRLADAQLRDPETVSVADGRDRTATAIEQRAHLVHGRDKLAALLRVLETEDVASALVFVRTRAATTSLAADLTRAGWAAEALSGEMSQAARTDVLGRFRRGDLRLLVATDVAARGLDIDHVSHVFNVDLPVEAEAYVHRVGRTGRAGRAGVAVSLVAPGERNLLRRAESAAGRELPLLPLPSVEAVAAVRAARLRTAVEAATPADADRALVAALVAEGADAMDVAVRALAVARAARGETEIAPVADVFDRPQRPQRAPFGAPHAPGRPAAHAPHGGAVRRGPVGRSHEDGMVRLVLSAGRTSGVRPNVVVGALASSADVPGRALGKIVVQERRTYVDVPEALVERVLAQSGAVRMGPRAVTIERA